MLFIHHFINQLNYFLLLPITLPIWPFYKTINSIVIAAIHAAYTAFFETINSIFITVNHAAYTAFYKTINCFSFIIDIIIIPIIISIFIKHYFTSLNYKIIIIYITLYSNHIISIKFNSSYSLYAIISK